MREFIKQRLHESFTDGNAFYHGSPYLFDKFNIERVGSGDGLSKYGHGLYFSDNQETAIYYAKELSIGQLRDTGLNVYTVRLFGLEHFLPWEEEIPSHVFEAIITRLTRMGHSDEVDTLNGEYEEYGTLFSLRSMYEYLEVVLGNKKDTTEFLNFCGVNGAIAQSPAHDGNVYVAYSDDIIRIITVDKIN